MSIGHFENSAQVFRILASKISSVLPTIVYSSMSTSKTEEVQHTVLDASHSCVLRLVCLFGVLVPQYGTVLYGITNDH